MRGKRMEWTPRAGHDLARPGQGRGGRATDAEAILSPEGGFLTRPTQVRSLATDWRGGRGPWPRAERVSGSSRRDVPFARSPNPHRTHEYAV